MRSSAALAGVDGMTLQDRLDQLDLGPADLALANGLLAGMTGAPLDQASFSNALRWWALGEYNYASFIQSLMGFKFENGTRSLLERILADGDAEVRLSHVVSAIDADDHGVRVTVDTGEVVSAAAVVVATPPGVWPDLAITPGLPENWLRSAREGMQVENGAEAAAVIKGESRSLELTTARGVGMFTSHVLSDDEQIVTLFPGALDDPTDITQVQAELASALPGVEVLEMVADTYNLDNPFARGDWGFLRPGQLTTYQPHTMRRHGERLFFANSEVADLWVGFIDGAIETGLHAGRDICQLLETK
ncbi:FAD-dependent oxidoreductase [Nocardia sp. NPDC060256]|uniref:FAD-dependent oxidoreductase n=1 Tax=unclassified Nocardia TaxID=2637762 RepID=UPI003647E282